MTKPRTIEGREYKKFVDSPTRGDGFNAVEVVVGNPGDIGGSDNVEKDFADGDVSAVKAVYKTVDGVALASNNLTISEASVVGITRTAALDGSPIEYQIIGKFQDSSLSFPVNDQIYLDMSNGNLTF